MGHGDIEILHVDAGDDVLDLKTIRTVEGEVPKMAQKIISSTNPSPPPIGGSEPGTCSRVGR